MLSSFSVGHLWQDDKGRMKKDSLQNYVLKIEYFDVCVCQSTNCCGRDCHLEFGEETLVLLGQFNLTKCCYFCVNSQWLNYIINLIIHFIWLRNLVAGRCLCSLLFVA